MSQAARGDTVDDLSVSHSRSANFTKKKSSSFSYDCTHGFILPLKWYQKYYACARKINKLTSVGEIILSLKNLLDSCGIGGGQI